MIDSLKVCQRHATHATFYKLFNYCKIDLEQQQKKLYSITISQCCMQLMVVLIIFFILLLKFASTAYCVTKIKIEIDYSALICKRNRQRKIIQKFHQTLFQRISKLCTEIMKINKQTSYHWVALSCGRQFTDILLMDFMFIHINPKQTNQITELRRNEEYGRELQGPIA